MYFTQTIALFSIKQTLIKRDKEESLFYQAII